MQKASGKLYPAGYGSQLMYLGFGMVTDWVCQEMGVNLSITIELRPTTKGDMMKIETRKVFIHLLTKLYRYGISEAENYRGGTIQGFALEESHIIPAGQLSRNVYLFLLF